MTYTPEAGIDVVRAIHGVQQEHLVLVIWKKISLMNLSHAMNQMLIFEKNKNYQYTVSSI